jgi:nucleoside-triphosphatase
MAIYIFSRPVRSGKTTELLNWCRQQQNMAGILMPDVDGSRKIYDIGTGNSFDVEYTGPATDPALFTIIGRFKFYTAAFEKANDILITSINKNCDWVVVDEIGRLELDGKGFYRAMQFITARYNDNKAGLNLLLTVRDSLCDEVARFFKIKNYQLIHSLDEIEQA